MGMFLLLLLKSLLNPFAGHRHEIRYCRIINNADRLASGLGGANINISGYHGMLIHDNVLIQTQRAVNHNGNILAESASEGGYQAGLEYYNNKSYKKG